MSEDDKNVTTSQEARYAEVSLRAVELLAKAQRAADEAVAEAQSYARDLEKSAREQYRQILQRAQTAAQQVANAEGARGDMGAAAGAGTVDAQQLAYVRTYARVAHTQLKSVLAALNEELDQLAAMAEGSAPGPSLPSASPAQADRTGTYGAPLDAGSRPGTEPAWQPSGAPAPTGQPASRPTGQPGSRPVPTPTPTDNSGATSWPPIATASNSVSYFHRGSGWEGPH